MCIDPVFTRKSQRKSIPFIRSVMSGLHTNRHMCVSFCIWMRVAMVVRVTPVPHEILPTLISKWINIWNDSGWLNIFDLLLPMGNRATPNCRNLRWWSLRWIDLLFASNILLLYLRHLAALHTQFVLCQRCEAIQEFGFLHPQQQVPNYDIVSFR